MTRAELTEVEQTTLDENIATINRLNVELLALQQAVDGKRAEILRQLDLTTQAFETVAAATGLTANDFEIVEGHAVVRRVS
jgi:hypothetical protein